ncbi:hypothetical protein COCMIDRAFT_39494 [Bipolaris oryzae ATCC 44560]|uniref:DUF7779 domain-containing protein n=1 Tax=Bipolaris oryzae ATCC 44560 TaxID=930090 RepID=W6YXZ0_COCMI|nr:uncharacterized protein COCMIDRAFT_39494 [Bipolaris oryzae ATCC 44560]EUC42438.1 hypothetical protein COCMIDRAFT_39494 [Bipolaris oryzae ATCC 44560]
MVPFSQDSFFIGRGDVIRRIKEKSQIAIEYAYQARKETPHLTVMWIHASSPERLQQEYTKIAEKLQLPGWDDPKANVLKLVCDWLLDSQNGQWLMILDNVDETEILLSSNQESGSLESYLPQTTHGTILITSRNKIAAANLVGVPSGIIEVEPMSEEDAVALLHTRVSSTQSDPADAKALVQALECIPLAITHAAAYIHKLKGAVTISGYLNLFRESEANQVRLLSEDGLKDIRRDPSIRHAVISTWEISFEHIRKTERSAADLLALMSMFHRQDIPRKLLQGTTSELDFNDALAPLLGFSFVKIEVGQQAMTIYRLVQLSMRRWLEKEKEKEIEKWVKESTRAMNMVFPSGEYGTWEECRVLLPHFKETISHATTDKESVHGRENKRTMFHVNNLAIILGRLGKSEEAEDMHRKVLQGRKKMFGCEDSGTLSSISNLAEVLLKQGKLEEAEDMQRRALQGREKIFKYTHPKTLHCANHLAILLMKQRKWNEAEDMHRRVLEGYETLFGHQHPKTLNSLYNLGFLFHRQRRCLRERWWQMMIYEVCQISISISFVFFFWEGGRRASY